MNRNSTKAACTSSGMRCSGLNLSKIARDVLEDIDLAGSGATRLQTFTVATIQ